LKKGGRGDTLHIARLGGVQKYWEVGVGVERRLVVGWSRAVVEDGGGGATEQSWGDHPTLNKAGSLNIN